MTSRLPAALKKRLQANLENLTPKEAGRLKLIYYHEATGKKIRAADYRPMQELDAAFDARVAKERGKPGEDKAVDAHNGLVFLSGLMEVVNVEGPNRLLATAFDAYKVQTAIMLVVQQDAFGTLAQTLVDNLVRQPRPLPPDLYDQTVAWMNGDRLFMLSEVAAGEFEMEEEAVLESEPLQIPKEFAVRYATDPSEHMEEMGFRAIGFAVAQERQMRQDWAEAQGEEWLQAAFDNRRDRLEQWLKFADGYYTEADRETRQKAILADLVAKVKAGELVGGEAVDHHDALYSPVLIVDGRFPTWAALRILWRPFAESRDFRFDESPTIAAGAPGRAVVMRTLQGRRLSAEELRDLVAVFWKACRGRAWGKKLPAKPDLDALGRFLTLSSSPLLHQLAPDLGTINFDAWVKGDGHDLPWEKGPAATAASLHTVTGGYNWGEDELPAAYFYRRHEKGVADIGLAKLLAMTDSYIPRRQFFTYRRKEDEDEGLLPLSAIFGLELLTRLESVVARYRNVANELASIKAAITAIGDRYFDGMHVLTKMQSVELEQAEKHLADTNELLKSWLEELDTEPWNVDTTNLDPGEPEADKERVEAIVAGWLHDARRLTTIKDETGLLW